MSLNYFDREVILLSPNLAAVAFYSLQCLVNLLDRADFKLM